MSMGMIGAAVIGGGASIYASRQASKSAKSLAGNVPDLYEDPYYKKTQEKLYDTGSDLLRGKPNDYYKQIGEYGGQEFENVLGLLKRDVSTGVNEDLVRRGVGRGGIGATAKARAIGDISTKTRYADYERAMAGRGQFLDIGSKMLSDVRGGATNEEQIRNRFAIGATDSALGASKFGYEQDQDRAKLMGGVASGLTSQLYPALSGLFNRNTNTATGTSGTALNPTQARFGGSNINLDAYRR